MSQSWGRSRARRSKGSWLCAALFAAFVIARSGVASAYHTEDDHITDDTAWTLKGPKNWRLGLYKASVTIADRVVVGTYLWPWLARTPSAFAKLRFLSLGPWQWATEAGFFRLDTQFFDGTGADAPVFTVGTLALVNSLELNRQHQISTKLIGTAVRVTGQLADDTLRGNGSAALTNLQLLLAYEWRFSRSIALVVTGRYKLLQALTGETRFTATPDDYTRVDVALSASDNHAVNYSYAFSIVPAVAMSWESFNLRLGIGYGNFNIPGVNFMIERRTAIPELDLYWTF
jgi:hypothetical protein